jgi:septal ring factor EnvC (AmiA/AmiB activator)
MGPRKFWLCLMLALLAAPGWGQSDEEKARQELQTLQRDISRINSEISSARSRRNKLQEQLRKAEVALGELQKQVSQNLREIDQTHNRLKALQQQRAELEQARDLQQARVGTELRTAWQQGNQGQIKVLLNQESPHTVARSLAYYRYFFDARNKLIEQYRGTLEKLLEVQAEINKTALQLDQDNQALAKKQEQTRVAQNTREQAVASLSSSIDNKSGQLKELEEDRRELEELLVAIEEAVINLKVPENYQAFAEAKGKMPWPVAGKPSNRYGGTRNQGDMRWQGINIPAKSGSTVKAIHHGRVVYADWLRGSGLLLIIDHGDGYMSLYAHNQSLLREVGEWVTAETAISTVGNSGGLTRPTLYFEIRHKGKPTDPARWCKG